MVTLPEGEAKPFGADTSVADVLAALLSNKQRKQTVAAGVGDTLVDLSVKLDSLGQEEIELRPVVLSSDEGLDILRHSTAHLMAWAVSELYPGARFGFGPPVENGFYYDIEVEEPFTEDDLARIEKKMKELASRKVPIVRETLDPATASDRFGDQPFKVEQIELLKESNELFAYHMGEFTDLCEGPHVSNTGEIKAFKLQSVAGAYWRGDETREQLQRIYGTSWYSKKDLNAYLEMLEEAKKRDHRKLGQELDLFGIQDDAGGGLAFYYPKGSAIRNVLVDYWK